VELHPSIKTRLVYHDDEVMQQYLDKQSVEILIKSSPEKSDEAVHGPFLFDPSTCLKITSTGLRFIKPNRAYIC
jgi:hypothetical protein